jgi:diguanylate cyclase (GGDEF)-like protein/PAS domain S-box-containing protein
MFDETSAPGAVSSASLISAMREQMAELSERCRRMEHAQQISQLGSWEAKSLTEELWVSDSLLHLFGLERAATSSLAATLMACVHPDDVALVVADSGSEPSAIGGSSTRYRIIRASDGEVRWLASEGEGVRDAYGVIDRRIGTLSDVTEQVLAEQELRRALSELSNAHSYQQAVITASPDAIHIYDVATGSLARANRLAPDLIGYTDETISVLGGLHLETLLPAEDLARLNQAILAAQQAPDGEVVQLRHRVLHTGGTVRWLSRRLTPFARDAEGRVSQVLLVSRDDSDMVEVQEQLEHAALHDELTGLPNRRLVRDRLEHSLRRSERAGQVAILFCDLDGFKRINDSHGHPTGDAVLIATARRLTEATRAGDTVARMGGDEFVVMLEVTDEEDARVLSETVATRIERAICEPILVDGDEHSVTVSIGICLAEAGATAESILSDADAAMYQAKTHGANNHVVFELELRQSILRRDHVERQIRRALSHDGIQVFYQPIVHPSTNSLYGVEALLRVADADGSYLDTGEVVAIAEHTGLISALDDRVLHIACAQLAEWRSGHEYADLVMSINRSAKDITQPGFYDRISGALSRAHLDPRALTLEVTETTLLDVAETALEDLQRLHRDGVGVAIDDFGTGYASLRYLAMLPITCLKIDRSFTAGLPGDTMSMKLVRATIRMAEDLGIRCVVEGVESRQQVVALPAYRDLMMQGYLYGRPQSAEAFQAPRFVELRPVS